MTTQCDPEYTALTHQEFQQGRRLFKDTAARAQDFVDQGNDLENLLLTEFASLALATYCLPCPDTRILLCYALEEAAARFGGERPDWRLRLENE